MLGKDSESYIGIVIVSPKFSPSGIIFPIFLLQPSMKPTHLLIIK
jgi:hypothetical protein